MTDQDVSGLTVLERISEMVEIAQQKVSKAADLETQSHIKLYLESAEMALAVALKVIDHESKQDD